MTTVVVEHKDRLGRMNVALVEAALPATGRRLLVLDDDEARRGQAAHVLSLEAGIATIRHRLSLPVGEKGSKRAPGGYRSPHEWFSKAHRLHVLA